MATAAVEITERSVRGKRLTLMQPALTSIEQRVFDIYDQAARLGNPAPHTDDIATLIGAQGVATVAGITKRIEEKGYITRQVFQRGRMVCIAATGHCTAPPANTAEHWRFRTETPPTPAIQALRERFKPLAAMIEAEARMSGRAVSDFLADLVYIGWHEYQAEKESEA